MARVAAYYHDVGKLANPGAFIENQAGAGNVHDDLAPDVSAQVLKAHVADGIDIAYRAKLPKPLIAFIPQHHGTTRIAFFWAKARELAAAPLGGLDTAAGRAAADALDERRFRHNGPRPQSREAAILMLADGVEASVRSLSSQDEPTIRAMVGRIIDERLDDGQFDECDLTLRDLERIREAFVAQLLGMYHQRIAYPRKQGRGARGAAHRRRPRRLTAARWPPARRLSRPLYLPPFRVDLEVRTGVPRLVPAASLARILRAALLAGGAPEPAAVGLVLADDAELARLNAAHMGTRGPTDVLSFPLLPPEAYPPARGWISAAADAGARGSGVRSRRRPERWSGVPPPPGRPAPPRRHRGLRGAGHRAGGGGPRGPGRRPPLVACRRAAAARRPRRAPPVRLGPRGARRGGRDAGPRDGDPRRDRAVASRPRCRAAGYHPRRPDPRWIRAVRRAAAAARPRREGT